VFRGQLPEESWSAMRGVMFADLGIPNIQIRKICRTYCTWVVFEDVPSPYGLG